MTKIIGLTGGIGSGKTTIANYFKELGIPVYIADVEARKISESPEIIHAIKGVFGNEVFNNEKLDRVKAAEIVFNNEAKLKQLNEIIHPAVKKHFENWVLQHSNFPFVVKEAAILFESGAYKDCDIVISIIVPLETRIQRVIQRDGATRDDVLKRIKNQWTDEERLSKSQYAIENINIEDAKKEVKKILKKIRIY